MTTRRLALQSVYIAFTLIHHFCLCRLARLRIRQVPLLFLLPLTHSRQILVLSGSQADVQLHLVVAMPWYCYRCISQIA
jgi:hypothetical protein